MSDTSILALLGFIGALISIVAPVLKLNSNIVKLNTNFENMRQNDIHRDERITAHGKEIDLLRDRQKENEKILAQHSLRIDNLERSNHHAN